MYSTLRTIHVGLAILTVSGFLLRGAWMLTQSANLQHPIVRVAPHIVDTAFLITGIWLVVILRLDVMQQTWLVAKLIALILYIVFGAIALRHGRSIQTRSIAFAAALATFLYIVGVALNKSATSWLAA